MHLFSFLGIEGDWCVSVMGDNQLVRGRLGCVSFQSEGKSWHSKEHGSISNLPVLNSLLMSITQTLLARHMY